MSRRRWIVLAGAAALGIGLAAMTSLSEDTPLPLYRVQRGHFAQRVQAEGVLAAEEATLLTGPIAEEPMKIAWLAQEGTRVRAGDVVIRFDPSDIERELYNGQAERDKTIQKLREKKVQLEAELQNLERDARLAERQLRYAREFQSTDEEIFSRAQIIESEIDQTLAERRREYAERSRELRDRLGTVELALLELEKRKAELTVDKAESGLRELELRAPHDGIFMLRRDWGEAPAIGQIAFPAMPLAEIPRPEKMKALVYVLEADAGGVEVGVAADVRLEAHPDEIVAASVRRVAAVAKRRNPWSPVQYFEVELALARTDAERMKPGQRVRATLRLQELDDVLTVPREALFFDGDRRPYVFRARGGEFERVAVRLGPAAPGRVVIEEGLQEGEIVALGDPTGGAAGAGDRGSEGAPAAQGPGQLR